MNARSLANRSRITCWGLTALLMPGMRVTSFPAAFFGAIIIWLVSWLANKLVGDKTAAVAR